MVYNTFSPFAPDISGSVTASDINKVHNNPSAAGAVLSAWPAQLDSFVQKSNVDLDSFMVNDEIHQVSDIDQSDSNSLYLYHRIVPPAELSGVSDNIQVSNGVLQTGLVDYQAGKIHFATVPTGQFTVAYLAQPDPIHSAHINVLQNAIMRLQGILGAGSDLNNGFRNAEFLLHGSSPTGSLLNSAPNLIGIGEFTKSNFIIAGESGFQHSIELGNSYDTVHINASEFVVKASGGYEATTGTWPSPATGNLVIRLKGDTFIHGQTDIGVDWPGADVGTWSTSGEYTGAALRVYGDMYVGGTIYATGALVTVVEQQTYTGFTITDDWTVSGSLVVRDNATVDGNLNVGGHIAVETFVVSGEQFNGRRISFTNKDGRVTTVDGLDPSYLVDTLEFRGRDPSHNGVVDCDWSPIQFTEWYDPQGSTNFTGSRTRTWTGDVTSKTTNASGNWIHSDMPVTYQPAGIFENGAFDGELIVRWNNGPLQGREANVVKIVSKDHGDGYSTGCMFRVHNASHYTNANVGDQFKFILPGNQYCKPNYISTSRNGGDPTVTINASNAHPLVINAGGQMRRVDSSNIPVNMTAVVSDESSYPDNGTVYVYIYTRSVGDLFQAEFENRWTFYARPYLINTPDEAVIGQIAITRSAGSWTAASNDVITYYAPDAYYDSGWVMSYLGVNGTPDTHGIGYESSIADWGNGHTGAGPEAFAFSALKGNSKHYTLNHNIGDERKLNHSQLEVYIATSYWENNRETPTDNVNDIESNTLKKYMYNVKDYTILKQDRTQMYVAFDLPTDLEAMWNSSTWSEYEAPDSTNDVRAFVRFVIRPVRQAGLR